jgi:hypothetical protein
MSNLSRRSFLQLGTAAPALAASGKPKNLVFIIADQHSGTALGCTGDPIVRTPRLDALARQGALFTHAYTGGLICAPSRACLDTGLHVQTHSVRTNGVPLRSGIENIYAILARYGYVAPKQHSHRDVKGYLAWLRRQGYEDVASPIIGSKQKARALSRRPIVSRPAGRAFRKSSRSMPTPSANPSTSSRAIASAPSDCGSSCTARTIRT